MENTLNLVIMKRFRKLLPLLLVFPFIRGCHSVWCSSSASCFQCLSPLHQLSPYPPSLHLEIFSLASLFSSPNNSISITLLSTYSWSLLMTCSYHLSLPFLIFIPNFFYLNCTPDVLISNLIFSCHSQSKPQHFHLCNFHLFYLFLCNHHCLKSIHQLVVSALNCTLFLLL